MTYEELNSLKRGDLLEIIQLTNSHPNDFMCEVFKLKIPIRFNGINTIDSNGKDHSFFADVEEKYKGAFSPMSRTSIRQSWTYSCLDVRLYPKDQQFLNNLF